jgi:hypothetical protein
MQAIYDTLPECEEIPQEEFVAIRKEDWPSIHQAIEEAISPLKPRGWRKAMFLLREWTVLGVVLTIIVALLVFAATQFNLANTRLAKEATFETNTGRDIEEIKKDISGIRDALTRRDLLGSASLPLSDFKTALPEIITTITAAKQQEVKVSPKVLDNLQQKLIAAGETAPGYWPATAEFISYRSQAAVSNLQGLMQPNLPNCTDQEPTGMQIKNIAPLPGGQETGTLENAQYSNCRMTLDSPADNDKFNDILRHKSARITFTHCLIVYRGGPINLILEFKNDRRFVKSVDAGKAHTIGQTVVSGPTMEFVDCLLDFSVVGKPTPYGQQLAQSVLAQNGAKIILPNLSPHS